MQYKNLIRLYIPECSLKKGESCALSDGQAHYLRNVMRRNTGEKLRVFNGRDGEWLATLSELSKKNALIVIDDKMHEQKQSSDLWVLASPVKKEAFDLMVEKSCELGVARFFPVVCDHTVVHKINQERLQAISIESAEQSERLDVMTVEPIQSIKNLLNSNDYNRNIIFCIERSDAPSFVKVAGNLSGNPVSVLIGPEGGFSGQEIDFIEKFSHVHPASLGPRILRAETAVISAVSIIQSLT